MSVTVHHYIVFIWNQKQPPQTVVQTAEAKAQEEARKRDKERAAKDRLTDWVVDRRKW